MTSKPQSRYAAAALMMAITHPTLTIVVAVEDLDVHGPPVDYLRSYRAVKPDPTWHETDSSEHEHRWTITQPPPLSGRGPVGELPTCTSAWVHVDCGGSCGGTCEDEGYHRTVWHCRECGDEVTPGYVPDWTGHGIGYPLKVGPATVSLRTELVEGMPTLGTRVRAAISGDGGQPLLVEVSPTMIERGITGQTMVEWEGYVVEPA